MVTRGRSRVGVTVIGANWFISSSLASYSRIKDAIFPQDQTGLEIVEASRKGRVVWNHTLSYGCHCSGHRCISAMVEVD